MSEPVDVSDAEVVDEHPEPTPTTAALVHVQPTSALTQPVAGYDDVLTAFRNYEHLRGAIVTDDDYQQTQGKRFVKKSGWRKLAVAMGVSGEMQSRDYDRDDQGRITRAEVVVRAIAPNGRFMDGLGVCDFRERCKPGCFNEKRTGGICDGFNHFSKSQHDIPATAATRALNRACSDLFGFGEVSAEEVQGEDAPPPEGFESHEDAHALYDWIVQANRALPGYRARDEGGPDEGTVADTFIKWHRDNGFRMPYNQRVALKVQAKLIELGAEEPDVAAPVATPPAAPTPAERGASQPPAEGSTTSAGGDDVEARQSHTGPPEAASSPPTSPVPDAADSDGTVREPPGGGAHDSSQSPKPPTPAAPLPDSSMHQRREVGQLARELMTAGKLAAGDKAEIVAILSTDRVTSMADTNQEEAARVMVALKLIEGGEMSMADDPAKEGARAFLATSTRAQDFLAKVGLIDPSTP